MNLSDTVKSMESDDWKERLKAEYWQAKIRHEELHRILVKSAAGTLDFTPKCSIEILEEQSYHMENYLRMLEIRMEIEGIEVG